MAALQFKKGSLNYTQEQQQALYVLARRVASILNRLSEHDARIISYAIDPALDQYVLEGWDKRSIIQEAIEDMIADRFSPEQLSSDVDLEGDLFSISESIEMCLY